jgi:hypothetical protein
MEGWNEMKARPRGSSGTTPNCLPNGIPRRNRRGTAARSFGPARGFTLRMWAPKVLIPTNLLGDRQGARGFDRDRARRDGCPQRRDPACHESTAPKAHRILAHPEGLGDPQAGPARQGQEDRPGPISLAALPRPAERLQLASLLATRHNRGDLPAMIRLPYPDHAMESWSASVGHPAETCLERVRD